LGFTGTFSTNRLLSCHEERLQSVEDIYFGEVVKYVLFRNTDYEEALIITTPLSLVCQ